MRRFVAGVAVAACVAVPTTFALIGIRGRDLEDITQRNCAAINTLVMRRNEAAAKGRAIAQSLLEEAAQAQGQPQQTIAERRRTERFLDSLYYTLEPIPC